MQLLFSGYQVIRFEEEILFLEILQLKNLSAGSREPQKSPVRLKEYQELFLHEKSLLLHLFLIV